MISRKIPWRKQPQYPVGINPAYAGRLKALYVLNANLWRVNLVTGIASGTAVGAGHEFLPYKIRTAGAGNTYINLPLDGFSAVAPFTVVVGCSRISASGVSWSLLRRDLANWYGVYEDVTGTIKSSNNNDFSGVITLSGGAPVSPFTSYKAATLAGANNLRGAMGGGVIVVDSLVVMPTGGGLNSIALGAAVRNTVDNPCVADFEFIAVIDGAVTDAELQSLSSRPWAELLEPRIVSIFLPSAGGVTGTISSVLDSFTTLFSGTTSILGTITNNLENAISSLFGTSTVTGSLTTSLEDAATSLSGTITVTGTLTNTLDNFVTVLDGSIGSAITGSIAVTLDDSATVLSGTSTVVGNITVTLDISEMSMSGTTTIVGVLASQLDNITASFSGFPGAEGFIARLRTLLGVGV